MLFLRTLIVTLLAVLALAAAATCTAQVPQTMNYQVMLTDDADQPLADQSVQLVFRIYNVDAGGGSLWTETHNVTTNSIGVISLVLGSTTPLAISFEGPLWLQVEVDGEIMSPRRELTSAPYALSVSAGAAGDGHSLDADDGVPRNVVYVHGDGTVTVGDPVAVYGSPKLQVFGTADETAAYFKASTGTVFDVGVFARSDSSSGIIGNSKTTADYYAASPAAVVGVADMDAGAGAFFANGDGDGVYASSWGAGDALCAYAWGTGLSGYFDGGSGVEMVAVTYPVLQITNQSITGIGNCLSLNSQPGASSFSTAFSCECYTGEAGHFSKGTDDNEFAVYISSPTSTSEGLHVYGYIYSTSMMAREVETSRGKEAVFSVASPEVEMVASGKGRLSAGAARVDFDRTFAESITGPDGLRITATPIGGWSALYVEHIDADGFHLRSESGSTDVEFHWVAVGRAEGHERAPEVTIPDHEEKERRLRLREEEMKSRRPRREPPKRPSVMAAENQ